jgi:hypothetical protein
MAFFERAKAFLTKKPPPATPSLQIGSPDDNGLRSDANAPIPVQNGLVHSREEQAQLWDKLISNNLKAIPQVSKPTDNPDLGSGKPLGVYHLRDDRDPAKFKQTNVAEHADVPANGAEQNSNGTLPSKTTPHHNVEFQPLAPTPQGKLWGKPMEQPKNVPVKRPDGGAFLPIDDQKAFLKEFDTTIEDAQKPAANANSEPKALVGESKMWETGSTKNSGQSVQRREGSQKPPTVGDHQGLKKTR